MRAPGRLRRQPPPGPPPGGDHLDPRAGLHPRDLAHRRRPQPAQLRRAGRRLAPPAPGPARRPGRCSRRSSTPSCASCWARARSCSCTRRSWATGSAAWSPATCCGPAWCPTARRPSRSPSGSRAASSARWGREPGGRRRRPARPGESSPARADRIELRGLRAMAPCRRAPTTSGTHDQPLELDLDLVVDLAAAGDSDDLDDTVDYGAVCDARGGRGRASAMSQLLERAGHPGGRRRAGARRPHRGGRGGGAQAAATRAPRPRHLGRADRAGQGVSR